MLNHSPTEVPLPPSPVWSLDSPSLKNSSLLPVFPSYLKFNMTEQLSSESGGSIKSLEIHNHHQWSGSMMSYFLEHNLDGIVDGSEVCPDITLPAERANWILQQKKAAGFISRNMDSRNRDLLINDFNQKDPQAIWTSIKEEYSSKKARNHSRLFTAFLPLNCRDGNLSRVTTEFRQIISQLSDIGVKLDDDLLAHFILHLLPESHKTTKTVIITSAESSNTALSTAGVLSQIDELIKDNNAVTDTAKA